MIAPKIEDSPAKCKLKIAKSTAPPECAVMPDNGGYTVQPVPAPTSIILDKINNNKEGGNNQKLKLLTLEKPYPEHLLIKEPINYQTLQS